MKCNFRILVWGILMISSLLSLSAQTVGLVLSGGGARGITHIGVIKALEENNIPIDYITGTSMGAIVGSLYAMGYTPDDMITLVKSEDFKRWSTGDIDPRYVYYYRNADPNPGFVDLHFNLNQIDSFPQRPTFLPTNIVSPRQMNYAFLDLYSRANAYCKGDFSKLFVPFRCVASDIYKKQAVVLRKGDLGDAVRASMTFPFMFKPISINGELLFDGGIFNNFPIDVMKEDFHPDFILGSAVSSNPARPREDDIVKQIENMIVNKSDYQVNDSDGVLLDFKLDNVNIFDFSKVDELVKVGYDEVIKHLPEIKARIKREMPLAELQQKRALFKAGFPQLKFQNVYIVGVDSLQKKYIEHTFHTGSKEFSAEDFKDGYFKLISDDKISEVMPDAVYNDSTKLFDLYMKVKVHDQLKLTLGGNISSTTSNEAYFGVTYQDMHEYARTASLDAQFGRVYNGLALTTRVDFPTQNSWYLKLAMVFHRFDYYQGNKLFYDDGRTSYFNQSEVYTKFSIGLPVTMKGRAEFGLGYGLLTDHYGLNFGTSSTDVVESVYQLGKVYAGIETYTLNNVMYPVIGKHLWAMLQGIGGNESFKSTNNTTLDTDMEDWWLQLRAKFDRYYPLSKKFVLGTYGELALSSRELLNNYTASVIQAPRFEPTPHSKSIFVEGFSANQFAAVGVKPIYKITDQLHFRTEAYWFVPYQAIYALPDNTAAYRKPFYSTQFMAESTLVFDFKFASAGLFVNHYSSGLSRWNFGLNIGFLLFNNKFLQ